LGCLDGAGCFYRADGFGTVPAFAKDGGTAYLFDGPGADLFLGTPTYSYLQAGDTLTIASGFAQVRGFASTGADLALLFDSAGDDLYVGTPTYSYLAGGGFLNLASGFAEVHAPSAGGVGTAVLFDTAGRRG